MELWKNDKSPKTNVPIDDYSVEEDKGNIVAEKEEKSIPKPSDFIPNRNMEIDIHSLSLSSFKNLDNFKKGIHNITQEFQKDEYIEEPISLTENVLKNTLEKLYSKLENESKKILSQSIQASTIQILNPNALQFICTTSYYEESIIQEKNYLLRFFLKEFHQKEFNIETFSEKPSKDETEVLKLSQKERLIELSKEFPLIEKLVKELLLRFDN